MWMMNACFACCCALVCAKSVDLEGLVPRTAKISLESAVEIAKEAAATVHRANLPGHARVELGGAGCPSCVKDFSEPCPSSWLEQRDGTCRAPSTYKGICAKTQTFMGGSTIDKQEAENACGVCWPCLSENACERDWQLPCPHGYTAEPIEVNSYADATGTTCVADLGYQGGCESAVAFASAVEKQQFAERCEVSWPCRSTCAQTGMTLCPYDWNNIGDGICAAPSYYKMKGCSLLQSFQGWTPEMKADYADRCHVTWPCQEEGKSIDGSIKSSPCAALTLDSCPLSWTPSPEGVCNPPSFAVGLCTQPVQVGSMTTEEKLRWAGDCLLLWPCEETATVPPRKPWYIQPPRNGPIDDLI